MSAPHATPTTTFPMGAAFTVELHVPTAPPLAALAVLTHTTTIMVLANCVHPIVPPVPPPPNAKVAHPTPTPHTLDSVFPAIQ